MLSNVVLIFGFRYKRVFSKNKKYIYVAFVWGLSCLLNSPHALEMELSVNNASQPQCVWVTTIPNQQTRYTVAVLEFLGKYFLPVFITCATFISLIITVRKPNNAFLLRHGNAGVRLLRMCTLTAFILAICWFPNQFYYLLFKFNLTYLNVPGHHATVVLCMFNSCVNPWVYCAINKSYRRKFVSLLMKCFPVFRDVDATTTGSAAMEGSTMTVKNNNTLSTLRSSASCILDKINHYDNKAAVQSDHLEIIELTIQQPEPEKQESDPPSSVPSDDATGVGL